MSRPSRVSKFAQQFERRAEDEVESIVHAAGINPWSNSLSSPPPLRTIASMTAEFVGKSAHAHSDFATANGQPLTGHEAEIAALDLLLAHGAQPAEIQQFIAQHPDAHDDLIEHLHQRVGNAFVASVFEATAIASTAATSALGSPYDMLCAVLTKVGGKIPDKTGKITVLGVRVAKGVSRSYQDMFYVLSPDKTVVSFKGSTVPGQNIGSAEDGVPDVNRDGEPDVGMLAPGNFVAKTHPFEGKAAFQILLANKDPKKKPVDGLPTWRDTNHDGIYSDDEIAASQARGDKSTGVLFHGGADEIHPESVGCMNLQPSQLLAFVAAVGGANATFNYTLVDVATLTVAPVTP